MLQWTADIRLLTIKVVVDYRHQGTYYEGDGGPHTSGYLLRGRWGATYIRVLAMRVVGDYIHQGTYYEGDGGLHTSG